MPNNTQDRFPSLHFLSTLRLSLLTFESKPSSVEAKEDAQACSPFINLIFLHEDYGHEKQARMQLNEDEMKALRLLLREELQAEVGPFRHQVSKRFDEGATQMDGPDLRDEKREQEYLSIREQLRRLEARVV